MEVDHGCRHVSPVQRSLVTSLTSRLLLFVPKKFEWAVILESLLIQEKAPEGSCNRKRDEGEDEDEDIVVISLPPTAKSSTI